jgi:hypothetical protein
VLSWIHRTITRLIDGHTFFHCGNKRPTRCEPYRNARTSQLFGPGMELCASQDTRATLSAACWLDKYSS